jgi:hypothetical protein
MNESTKSDLSQLIGLTCERALARAQIRGRRRCRSELALGASNLPTLEPPFPAACYKRSSSDHSPVVWLQFKISCKLHLVQRLLQFNFDTSLLRSY